MWDFGHDKQWLKARFASCVWNHLSGNTMQQDLHFWQRNADIILTKFELKSTKAGVQILLMHPASTLWVLTTTSTSVQSNIWLVEQLANHLQSMHQNANMVPAKSETHENYRFKQLMKRFGTKCGAQSHRLSEGSRIEVSKAWEQNASHKSQSFETNHKHIWSSPCTNVMCGYFVLVQTRLLCPRASQERIEHTRPHFWPLHICYTYQRRYIIHVSPDQRMQTCM